MTPLLRRNLLVVSRPIDDGGCRDYARRERSAGAGGGRSLQYTIPCLWVLHVQLYIWPWLGPRLAALLYGRCHICTQWPGMGDAKRNLLKVTQYSSKA